jgi:sugar/nucleoside kinase (ribokinase family)
MKTIGKDTTSIDADTKNIGEDAKNISEDAKSIGEDAKSISGNAKPRKVMVAGHICLDITPALSSLKTNSLSEVLSPGKLVQVGAASVSAGGAVANTGLGMKILGADVTLAGKIGDDQFGGIIKKIIAGYGCAEELSVDRGSSTSYSVVLAFPGVDRIFLHNPGANDAFCAEDISEDALADVRHFHLGYPPLLRRMFLHEGAELQNILSAVKSKGIFTSLDMAAVDPASESGAQDWKAILRNVLPFTDFFLPSVEELIFMLDKNLYRDLQKRGAGGDITLTLSVERDVRPLADHLLEMGAKVLLIKCGVLGIYYRVSSDPGMRGLCEALHLNPHGWIGREGFEKSYVQENVVSGTGAGDTCIAAFLTAMLDGKDITQCVQLGAAAGACCVSAPDALSGLIPLNALQAKIDAGWKKLTRHP